MSGPVLYLKLCVTAVLWGGTFVAGRVLARHVPPFSAAFLRFVVATACLAVLGVLGGGGIRRLRRGEVLPVLLLGATGVFAYNYFFFSGLRTVEAGRAAVIIANNPVFIALASAAFLGERLRPRQAAGIAVSVAGALVVLGRGDPLRLLARPPTAGDAYLLGCVAGWVAYTVIGKAALRSLPPATAVTWACGFGAAMLAVPAHLEGLGPAVGAYPAGAWLCIGYLGMLGSALAFVWYYQGVAAIGPSKAGVFINLVPVSGVLLGMAVLGERVGASLAAGLGLVLAGIWMTNAGRAAGAPPGG